MNSKQKGKRGEREAARFLCENGFPGCRRGQQFSGSPDSPDVVGLPGWHIEVKFTENLQLHAAVAQAARDSGGKPWIVMHRRNRGEWMATLTAKQFLKLLCNS